MKLKMFKHAKIIDPQQRRKNTQNIFAENGKILSSVRQMEEKNLEEVDVKGYYLAPGFIDSHVHVFENRTSLGINADQVGIEQGVTTIVDAGSSGFDNFQLFKNEVIEKSKTNVKALINISKSGLAVNRSELSDKSLLMNQEEAKKLFSDFSNDCVGLKARMSHSVVRGNGVNPLIRTIAVATEIDVPVMVHIGNPPPYLADIFPLLRKGDIVTHAFHGKKFGIFDPKTEKMIPEALDALNRGVFFDIGHGSASFSYHVFSKFIEKYPAFSYSASTDIHGENYDNIVGSLMTTLSKLLSIGVPLQKIVESVTILPSERLNIKEKGTLEDGKDADFTVFDIVNQNMELLDSERNRMSVSQIMVPKMTIIKGEIVWKSKNF